jgi:hypothetical protein
MFIARSIGRVACEDEAVDEDRREREEDDVEHCGVVASTALGRGHLRRKPLTDRWFVAARPAAACVLGLVEAKAASRPLAPSRRLVLRGNRQSGYRTMCSEVIA